MHEEP
jgi:hypothetical protein